MTHVSGPVRSVYGADNGDLCVCHHRSAQMFPRSLWNVYEETVADGDQTNNQYENWNKAFTFLVEHSHLSVLVMLEVFQADLV